jgi:hypothetical protein
MFKQIYVQYEINAFMWYSYKKDVAPLIQKKSKAVPLYAMMALGEGGGIALSHSLPRH